MVGLCCEFWPFFYDPVLGYLLQIGDAKLHSLYSYNSSIIIVPYVALATELLEAKEIKIAYQI